MHKSLSELLSLEFRRSWLTDLVKQEGGNSFHLALSGGPVTDVVITADDDELVILVDGHTRCRFATIDYPHIRDSMRRWHLAADVARFLEELSTCRSQVSADFHMRYRTRLESSPPGMGLGPKGKRS